jgi:glycosyltransferase involved in cell wall biosynthesis
MKIAYVTSYDPRDIRNWSGLSHFIGRAFEREASLVEYIGPLQQKQVWLAKFKKYFYRAATGKRYLPERNPKLLQHYANQVAAEVCRTDPDVVFSPGTLPVAYLKCRQPVVFWTDATFAGMLNFYPGLTNVHQKSISEGMSAEQSALNNARLAIYSSDWAARSAMRDYGADPEKVKVVPFGANIECDRTLGQIKNMIDARLRNPCQLLFLAVDWFRKRGEVALEVTRRLNAQGLATHLTIVGCQPLPRTPLPPSVRCLGFISKADKEGRQKFDALLRDCHFLILPSIADCTPVVFSEANSFGVPCLTSDVGGIPTLIRKNVNGMTFPLTDTADAYVKFIQSVMSDKLHYTRLALSSFGEYQMRLNWDVAGRTVYNLLVDICKD